MNLRKDHCRDPDQNRPRTRHPCRRARPPPRPAPRPPGRNRTHGADGVKEHIDTPAPPGRPWPVGGAARYHELIHTTLGNGYLGSRIDEERSEMRYLV